MQPGTSTERQRGCLSKKRYQSKIEAELSRSECMQKRPVTLRVYPCRLCGGWHLTSKPLAAVGE